MPLPPIDLVDQISGAMTLASLRHQAIASNIANRDAVGYQRLAVRFTDAFQSAGPDNHPTYQLAPEVTERGLSARATPSLEADMVALSSNAMNFQVLAKALSRHFSIAELVVGGGRG